MALVVWFGLEYDGLALECVTVELAIGIDLCRIRFTIVCEKVSDASRLYIWSIIKIARCSQRIQKL